MTEQFNAVEWLRKEAGIVGSDRLDLCADQIEALQKRVAELERQRDKFYGEANLERERGNAYKTVLDGCVEVIGEIPYGDIVGSIVNLKSLLPDDGPSCSPAEGIIREQAELLRVAKAALEHYAEKSEWSASNGSRWKLLYNSEHKDGDGYETAVEALAKLKGVE